jgi:acyl carrier protein
MTDLTDKLKQLVADRLNVSPDKITDESRFVEDLGADSLDFIELVMMFEERFGYEIPEDAAERLTTFGEAAKYLNEASERAGK